MNKEEIFNMFKNKITSKILIDESLNDHTYFKIGGPADVMVLPNTIDDISKVIKLCKQKDIKYYIMGNGTNLLVRDKGIRGVVIKVSDNLNDIYVNEDKIIAKAGSKLSKIAKIALKNSLTGIEGISGVPGSLGGAVAMNAGAYGTEIKDVVTKVKCIDLDGNILEIDNKEMKFGYRHSRVHEEDLLVVEAEIKLKKGDYNEIKSHMDELTKKRNAKQPINLASAGSTFKRPKGDYAARLIEVSGLKGARYKDAQVSDKHCGFVVNLGNANCEDVLNLIRFVQKTVRDKHNILLEPEVKIIGEK